MQPPFLYPAPGVTAKSTLFSFSGKVVSFGTNMEENVRASSSSSHSSSYSHASNNFGSLLSAAMGGMTSHETDTLEKLLRETQFSLSLSLGIVFPVECMKKMDLKRALNPLSE